MQTVLVILIVLAAIGALVALIRGIIAFLQHTEQDLKGEGISVSGQKQNRMMQQRVMFQALAVLLVAVLLLFSRGS